MAKNKNIESFFKRRVESFDFPYQESDWLLLEQKLDAEAWSTKPDKKVFSGTKRLLVLTIGFTLAFVLGWVASNSFKEKLTEQSNQPVVDKRELHTEEVLANSKTVSRQQHSTTSEKPSEEHVVKPKSQDVHKQAKAPTWANNGNSFTAPIMGNIDDRKPKSRNFTEAQVPPTVTDAPSVEEKSHTVSATPPTIIEENTVDTLQEWPVLASRNAVLKNTMRMEPYFNLPYPQGNRTIASIPPKGQFAGHWLAGVSIAPDYTSVTPQEKKLFAFRVGANVYYQATQRITICTGVLYSNKQYETNAENYDPPEGYWAGRTNGVIPDNIDCSCRVIDVPLNFTFALLEQEYFGINTTIGISNYWLLDEQYRFEFGQENPGAETGWETNDNSFALLSAVNLGLGVALNSNPRLQTEIAAFYKIPTKKVGWGNVELHSMGIQLSLKYRIWVKKALTSI